MVYHLIIPRIAYNVGKNRGTVRGTEAGTVRGWKSRKWGLDRSKLGHPVLGIAH